FLLLTQIALPLQLGQRVVDFSRGSLVSEPLTHVFSRAPVEPRGHQLVQPASEQGLPRVGEQEDSLPGHNLDVEMRTDPRTAQHGAFPSLRSSGGIAAKITMEGIVAERPANRPVLAALLPRAAANSI